MHTRLSRISERLAEERVDALLVCNLVNIRYLTGFSGSEGYLLLQPGESTLYVDGRYTEQAETQFRGGVVKTTPRDILGGVISALGAAGRQRLTFESRWLSHELWTRLTDALPQVTWTPTVGFVERLRAQKDADEIAAIARAVAITDDSYVDLLTWIAPGMSEIEVAARAEYVQRTKGASRRESQTAVGSGPRSAMPHCIASDRVLGRDEAVVLDLGCTVNGYTSDLTRTVFLGHVPEEFQAIHRIVGEAQARAVERIRPGVAGREIHAVAAQHIAKSGYGDAFPHALGHSIGLNIHERPGFSATETATIEAGNVITVEPGIYLKGRYGVRTEDVVAVTETGCRVLNATEHALAVC